MKKKQLDELKTKTIDELKIALSDLRDEVGTIKTNVSLGREKNTNMLKNKRKEMARILTFLTMKENVDISKGEEEAPKE